MTKEHITPSIELVEQWLDRWHSAKDKASDFVVFVAIAAAHWGADQELDACCELVRYSDGYDAALALRADRRPKPPSLKEQALEALDEDRADMSIQNYKLVRSVLESLPE